MSKPFEVASTESKSLQVVQPSSRITSWQEYGILPPSTADSNIDDPTLLYNEGDPSVEDSAQRLIGMLDHFTSLTLRIKVPKAVRGNQTQAAVLQVYGIDAAGAPAVLINAADTDESSMDVAAADIFDESDNSFSAVGKEHRYDLRGHKYALIIRKTIITASAGLDGTERIQYKVI